MLTWLFQGVGAFTVPILAVWAITLYLSLRWIARWRQDRRLLRLHKGRCARLERVRPSRVRPALLEAGYGELLRAEDPRELLDSWFVAQDIGSRLRGFELVANGAPLLGLFGTLSGFYSALGVLAASAGNDASSPIALMAPAATLAMKSTLLCLVPTLVAMLVPGLFVNDDLEVAVRDGFLDLSRAAATQARRES